MGQAFFCRSLPLLLLGAALLRLCLPAWAGAPQQESLREAIYYFETLRQDKERGARRDLWEQLAERFAAIAVQGQDFAGEAWFYRARSMEELAERSKSRRDYRAAAGLYTEFALKLGEHALADNALYNHAVLRAGPLRDKPGAVKLLDELISRYPDADMRREALALRAGLQPEPAASPPPSGSAAGLTTVDGRLHGLSGKKNARAPSSGALLAYLEWEGNASEFSLTIGLAGRAKYRRATLPPDNALGLPARVVLELLHSSPAKDIRRSFTFTGSPLAALNISEATGGITRLDLDLGSARSYKVTVLDNPYRLLLRVSAERVLEGAEDLRVPARRPGPAPVADNNIATQLGLDVKTIMLDAGHGGRDPGAVGQGLHEADITLKLTRQLGDMLKKQGFNVIFTREDDRYVALEERTSLANSKRADIFISIHVNSSTNSALRGLETYYLDAARSDAAALVAARENSVNVNDTSDLQFILSDLTRSGKKEESAAVARLAQLAALKRLHRAGFQVRDNGVRSAPFHVLMGARMPAFLLEAGYISNAADAACLVNPAYIQALAEGISEGVMEYRARIGRMNKP